MSDSVDWVVDAEAGNAQAQALAVTVTEFLVAERIVLPRPRDDVWPRAGRLLPPGAKAGAWSVHLVPERSCCGLEVVTERKVFHSGANGVDQLSCPQCAATFCARDLDWERAVQAWHFAQPNDTVLCPACDARPSIPGWRFHPFGWAFGHLGFGFNNWSVSRRLVDAIAEVLGRPCLLVYEHY